MRNVKPILLAFLVGIPLSAYMNLTPLGCALVCGGLCALFHVLGQ